MQTFNSKKIGKLALIAEHDTHCELGKTYLLWYLFKKLIPLWDIDILLMSSKGIPSSPLLKELESHILTFAPSPSVNKDIAHTNSYLINSALLVKDQIAKATPLYSYLHSKPSLYDAFVFVGITISNISLLPLTKKRNCMIPLLPPKFAPYIGTNIALRFALLSCDYFFCHSPEETGFINSLQPHAEIRTYPIMTDIEFFTSHQNNFQPFELQDNSALILAEYIDETVKFFANKLNQQGMNVLCSTGANNDIKTDFPGKIINFSSILKHFNEIIRKTKVALFFMNKDFFPFTYNLSQHYIPIYVSRIYPWQELFNTGISQLSFDEDITIASNSSSKTILPHGYHHYKMYTNYLIKHISEWSIDNKIRWNKLQSPQKT